MAVSLSGHPINVVITAEGLATAALGCYGCSWNHTPAIDGLAATGLVWDRLSTHLERPGSLIACWLDGFQQMIRQADAGARSLFITDDPTLAFPPDGFGFDWLTRVEPTTRTQPSRVIEQTALAETFAAAIDQTRRDTRWLWIHTSRLRDAWDYRPPEEAEFDDTLEPPVDPVDELEPETMDTQPEPPKVCLPDDAQPPTVTLREDDDPDLVFGWMQRYAAMVGVLDQMIDGLMMAMRPRPVTVVLAGASGYSLGENGSIGHRTGPLRSGSIRLPLIISTGGPLRVGSLVSAATLPQLLMRLSAGDTLITPESWSADLGGQASVRTDSDRASTAITTPQWFYVRDEESADSERLFLKPDDVHDINDVSRLRQEVVEAFRSGAGLSQQP